MSHPEIIVKKKTWLILMLCINNLVTGQTNNFELINSTGRKISIHEIFYDKDSIKTFGQANGFCEELKGKPCAMTALANIYDM